MRKKNRLMLAAAIGMVAIVVATSAVRCSVAQVEQEQEAGGDAAATAQVTDQSAHADPQSDAGAQPAADDAAAADILAVLEGNAWQADGAPEKTVTFRDGSFIESDGASVKLAAFDVKCAGEGEGQLHLDVDIVRDGGARTAATIIVEGQEGALSVACDGFANEKRYVQGGASSEKVRATGLAEPYTGLIDGKEGELATAIDAWCKGHAPSAAEASFDGEVYVDVNGGRVSATFHLDDAASTIVTAVYEDGAFSVLG